MGNFFAGPALSGTQCGKGKWCDGGICVDKDDEITEANYDLADKTNQVTEIESKCESQCLVDGKGIEELKTLNGKSIFFANRKICDDSDICNSRRSVISYGTQKCQEFSRKVDDIDPNGYGLQGSYNSLKVWMSCAIYCKRRNSTNYFTPRYELNEFGVNPYFPDGTLCHRDKNINYYCIKAHCLPDY